MRQPNSILQNRYKIRQLLKAGSMGAVYLAYDQRLAMEVAVKEMRVETALEDSARSQMQQAFLHEARLLASLKHSAIPAVYDCFNEDGTEYLVMEYVSGTDLAELLRRQKVVFDYAQVLGWTTEILDVLDYLHTQTPVPVVHRDIKPSNLKLTANGEIKLLDFGIAKGALTDVLPLEEASLPMATLEYAPLEQSLKACPQWREVLVAVAPDRANEFLGFKTDVRTDLFALAATVYRLLTGKLPVDAQTRALHLWTGKADPLTPLHALRSDVPVAVSAFLHSCLALEPSNRPTSAREMRDLLRQAAVVAAPDVTAASAEQTSGRKRFAPPTAIPARATYYTELTNRLEELMMHRATLTERLKQLRHEVVEAQIAADRERREREEAEARLREALRRLEEVESAANTSGWLRAHETAADFEPVWQTTVTTLNSFVGSNADDGWTFADGKQIVAGNALGDAAQNETGDVIYAEPVPPLSAADNDGARSGANSNQPVFTLLEMLAQA